jgi:hypothetical protein
MDDCVTNCCEFVKVSADLVIVCWRYAQRFQQTFESSDAGFEACTQYAFNHA